MSPESGVFHRPPRSGPEELPKYLAELTPLLLRADTRVIDHSYVNNTVQPFQAILQAGTAVLVDDHGLPRVRCVSGSPLTRPETPGPNPGQTGQPWPGFDPAAVLTVSGTKQLVKQFGLVDLTGAKTFRRPAGSTGANDFDQTPVNGALDGSYKLTGMQTICENVSDCADSRNGHLYLEVSDCTTQQCMTISTTGRPDSNGIWETKVPLARDGDIWRASGDLSDSGFSCNGTSTPTNFILTLTITDAAVSDTAWIANSVQATFEKTGPPAGACDTISKLSFELTGSRSG